MNPALGKGELDEREQKQDCKENPGHRARLAHLEVFEGVSEYVEGIEEGIDIKPV